jgi:hypothetical protein
VLQSQTIHGHIALRSAQHIGYFRVNQSDVRGCLERPLEDMPVENFHDEEGDKHYERENREDSLE